ncbi:MAG: fibronectin type III domain-containing protein, partial [Elusimicrobiota bacterium]|nr:fibronectin type III domain-containing protein [Elusimicrobiota bacterium]
MKKICKFSKVTAIASTLFVSFIIYNLAFSIAYAQPEAITNLESTSGSKEGEIQLKWSYPYSGTLPAGSTYFIQYSTFATVEWSTTSAQINISTEVTTTNLLQIYTCTGLSAGKEHYFRIWVSSPPGVFSPISNGATAYAYLDAPKNFTAIAISTYSILWQWDYKQLFEGVYIVRQATSSADLSSSLPASTTQWTYTGLLPNTSYYNLVIASITTPSTVISSSTAISTFTLANPPVSSQFQAVWYSSITIQWSANSNPPYTRWGILRSTDNFATSSDTLKGYADNYTSTSYTDSGLASAATYWYKVNAFNENGIATVYDTTISTITLYDSIPPTVIDNQLGDDIWRNTDPGNIYDIDFEDNVELKVASYTVYSQPNLSDTQLIPWTTIADNINSPTYTADWGVDFELLQQGTNYVSVIAEDLAGNTTTAIDVFYILKDTIPPAAVTDLAAQPGATEGEVKLSWSAPGDDDWSNLLSAGAQFKLQYSTCSSVEWSITAAQVSISTSAVEPNSLQNFTLTGLESGATYYIRLWTKDKANNFSELSNIATCQAQVDVSPPAPITEIFATGGFRHVKLRWIAPYEDDTPDPYNKGISILTYHIKYASFPIVSEELWQTATTFTIIVASQTSPGAEENLVVTGLINNLTYYFAIKSADESHGSASERWSIVSSTPSEKGLPYNTKPYEYFSTNKPTAPAGHLRKIDPNDDRGVFSSTFTIELTWDIPKSPGADDGDYGDFISSYTLIWYCVETSTTIVPKITSNSTTYTFPSTLEDTTVYWYIYAYDTESAYSRSYPTGSPSSDRRIVFNTFNSSPTAFNLIKSSGIVSYLKAHENLPVNWSVSTDPDPGDFVNFYTL